MKNQNGGLLQIWRSHLIVALLVGLVVGTGLGVAEGLSVLHVEGLFGRYNELVAWAIVFDAPATIVVELALAVISAAMFSLMRLVPMRRHLVALQLGETAFAGMLIAGIWLEVTVSPAWSEGSWLVILLPSAIAGILLGGFVLGITMWIIERASFVQRLQARYWVALEAVVLLAAIAFGFSR
jgi:hypothetical protein